MKNQKTKSLNLEKFPLKIIDNWKVQPKYIDLQNLVFIILIKNKPKTKLNKPCYLFGSVVVVAVAFQSVFHSKMHQNDVFFKLF
jgi:hypothetical protein